MVTYSKGGKATGISLSGEFSCAITQICCYAETPTAWAVVKAQSTLGHPKVCQDSRTEEDLKV